MTEHEMTRKNLAALIAGSLSNEDDSRTRAHLSKCAECARHLNTLSSLAGTLRNFPPPEFSQRKLTRLTALVQERRDEIIERQQYHRVIAVLAVYSWVMFLLSLSLLSPLNHALEKQFGWPPLIAGLTNLILWGIFCWTIGFGLIPLLHIYKINRQEKRL
jgi:anti-sigma factor RsiW